MNSPESIPHSMLITAGPQAEKIAHLFWLLTIICSVVFVMVMLLFWLGLKKNKFFKTKGPLSSKFILLSGAIIPGFILFIMLLLSLEATEKVSPALSNSQSSSSDSEIIRITGHQWWWEIDYEKKGLVTANELTIPVGEDIKLILTSKDVIHSLWIPSLRGKMDAIPGQDNILWIKAQRPGTFRGFCAEYCGTQHAHMQLLVHAVSPKDYVKWIEHHSTPALASGPTQAQSRGRELFFKNTCHQCHTIRGAGAQGTLGPDLTHIGSRSTLGSGIIHNSIENLAKWIANPHLKKPGLRMPSTELTPEELKDLAEFLWSLK